MTVSLNCPAMQSIAECTFELCGWLINGSSHLARSASLAAIFDQYMALANAVVSLEEDSNVAACVYPT